MSGLYQSKIPPRNVDAEAQAAWIAVDKLTTADPGPILRNETALREIIEKCELMLAEARQAAREHRAELGQ